MAQGGSECHSGLENESRWRSLRPIDSVANQDNEIGQDRAEALRLAIEHASRWWKAEETNVTRLANRARLVSTLELAILVLAARELLDPESSISIPIGWAGGLFVLTSLFLLVGRRARQARSSASAQLQWPLNYSPDGKNWKSLTRERSASLAQDRLLRASADLNGRNHHESAAIQWSQAMFAVGLILLVMSVLAVGIGEAATMWLVAVMAAAVLIRWTWILCKRPQRADEFTEGSDADSDE